MRITEKKKTALYGVIYEQVMRSRIEIAQMPSLGGHIKREVDEVLWELDNRIFSEVCGVLNVDRSQGGN